MKLVLSTTHLKTYFYEEYNIFYSEWETSANQMSREEFKQAIIEFANRIREYKVRGFLTNSQKGHFTMDIGIQEWHDQEVAPIYVEVGVKKIGFILPDDDFFAAISLQQTFDETQAKQLQTNFFNSKETAMDWMKD
jgi:hypothetical protein